MANTGDAARWQHRKKQEKDNIDAENYISIGSSTQGHLLRPLIIQSDGRYTDAALGPCVGAGMGSGEGREVVRLAMIVRQKLLD